MPRSKKCYPKHDDQPFENCICCGKKINPSFQEKLDAKVAAVPLETKQKILDLLHEGKNVGQVCEAVKLELLIVGQIILTNIEHLGYDRLREKALP